MPCLWLKLDNVEQIHMYDDYSVFLEYPRPDAKPGEKGYVRDDVVLIGSNIKIHRTMNHNSITLVPSIILPASEEVWDHVCLLHDILIESFDSRVRERYELERKD
jgi:hypothetical protein